MPHSKHIRADELFAYCRVNRGLRICLKDSTEGTVVEASGEGELIDLFAVGVEHTGRVKVTLAGGDCASFHEDDVVEVRSDHEIVTPPFR